MGQFSWLDCKTKEQILDDVCRDVYVLVPEEFGGGHILETCYDGYGNFGGHDIYDLIADWNQNYVDESILEKLYDDDWYVRCGYKDDFMHYLNKEPYSCEKRTIGIIIGCYDEDNVRLRYPIKITHDKDAVYEYCAPSLSDPNQGWKY